MSVPGPRVSPLHALRILTLLVASGFALGVDCGGGTVSLPGSGSALYESPQVDPLALSADGTRLYVANTTSGTLSVLDVANPASPSLIATIKVGHDPVGVAVRPKASPEEDELVFVTNHVSDSISVVSRAKLDVVQTIQALDANGVSTTDEPVGIAFAGPNRAFVALDQPNQVLRLDLDAAGVATIHPTRLAITAQAPRALAVAGNRLYVAAFESGNETEFGTCGPNDPRGFDPDPNAPDQGCEFKLTTQFFLQFVQSPNVGGRVIHDTDVPDRDLFVFDTDTLAPVATIEGIGTLLYGVATNPSGSRIYVTNTDARNLQNGLLALGNRMFENRLTFVDCSGGCTSFSSPSHVDLDASAPGAQTVPTPYGIATSADGDTLVVTAAGADGLPGLPGLFTLDATGTVLGAVTTGAIPQGVALRSDPATGAARTAYVLDTVDSSVTAVDVSNPAAPAVLATVGVGADPTPAAVKRGRIAFHSARGSTNGTFACGSCHPAGNEDQLLWAINTVAGPGGSDPNGAVLEPRTTMPIRGLRDTLPLHWDGSLGDPFPGAFVPGDTAPDCSLAGGDLACFRDLVDASLAGVMCDPTSCPVGPSGLPGALDSAQRDDMAAFLGAVSYPPSPKRRPTDALTTAARQGVRDFFTNDDGAGLGLSCGDNAAGCHALPLGVSTNSATVGRFDAPSIRGLWDRSLVFSNAIFSSQETLAYTQGLSGGTIWNPAVGMTERGSFLATFPAGFQPAYGVPGTEIWEFITQMSVGLPGLTGRQVSLSAATAALPATIAAMDQLEAAAALGKITAVASGDLLGELRYWPVTGRWTNTSGSVALSGAELRSTVGASAGVVTLIADLPANVQAGGARQPLLSPQLPDPGLPNVPRPTAGTTAVLTLAQSYVDSAARVLVDGAACTGCSFTLPSAGAIELTLSPVPASGPHVIQVLNPDGLASNEMPIISQ